MYRVWHRAFVDSQVRSSDCQPDCRAATVKGGTYHKMWTNVVRDHTPVKELELLFLYWRTFINLEWKIVYATRQERTISISQVFFLVVGFGLFHGLVLLPTVLSICGPAPIASRPRGGGIAPVNHVVTKLNFFTDCNSVHRGAATREMGFRDVLLKHSASWSATTQQMEHLPLLKTKHLARVAAPRCSSNNNI